MLKQISLVLLVASMFTTGVHAANVTGSSAAVWTIPSPPAGLVATGVGTPTLTNGQPFGGGAANSVSFAGEAFFSGFDAPFKLGTITYYNGQTSGVLASAVNLALTLNFSSPAIPPVISNFIFNWVITNNTADPIASADYLYLPSAFSDTKFTIGSTEYQVKIDGFQNIVGDGFLVSDPLQLHVLEDHSASADLYGRVVATDLGGGGGDVPEPGSLALIALGFAALCQCRRMRFRQAAGERRFSV